MQTETPYQVLAPGPVNLHPKVREILGLPMIHHRTPEFDAILKSTLQKLPLIFQTQNPCFIVSAAGSGGMEAALINVLRPHDEVLAIVSGKFGERWRDMAKAFGAKLTELQVPWGQAVKPEDVQLALQRNPKISIVLSQACETSTGVAHPIQKISQVIQDHSNGALFLVDAITALGAYRLPMDEWHLDAVVGGSQKAFMCPAGLSFVSFSKRAWERVEYNPTPRFYFDLRLEKKANDRGETWLSSNVPYIRALDCVLDLMLTPSLDSFFKTIQQRSDFTQKFFPLLGLTCFPTQPSPSLSVLTADMDLQKVRLRLEQKHHVTVMGGQDQLKGRVLRIGHMGYIQNETMTNLFFQVADVIRECGHDVKLANEDSMRLEMENFWRK